MELLEKCPPYQNKEIIKKILKNKEYKTLTFKDILIDETRKVKKIKKGDYLKKGKYQIIDQGQDYIGGYSDIEDKLYKETPFIVFGDHTRIVKLINNPSFIGADGVKVLNINENMKHHVNIKYMYYYLIYSDIPSRGYSRHFKYIKQLLYVIPSIKIQKQIVEVLDKTQTLIDNRKEQIELLDDLIESIFYEMFGNPVSNDKGWEETTIGESCYFVKDGPHKSLEYSEYGIPFLSVKDIINGFWDFSKSRYISQQVYEKYKKRCKPEYGDILYTKGGTTGFAKLVDIDIEFLNWVHIAVLKFDKNDMDGKFFETMLNTSYCYQQSQRYTRGIANRDLVLGEMKKIKHFLPPIDLQNEFAEKVQVIQDQKQQMQQTLKLMEDNYNSLMQKAFKGELF